MGVNDAKAASDAARPAWSPELPDTPAAGDTGARFPVALAPTPAQWAYAISCLALAWTFGLVVGPRLPSPPEELPIAVCAASGVLWLATLGYLIYLRVQAATLAIRNDVVELDGVAGSRAGARIALGPWMRWGRAGTVVWIQTPERLLRVGIRARAEGVALPAAPASVRVDAVLAPEHAVTLLSVLEPGVAAKWTAREPKRASALATMKPWLLTILFLAAFGPLAGPSLDSSEAGRLVLFTVTFAAVTLGLVATVGGSPDAPIAAPPEPARPGAARSAPRRSYARAAGSMLGFWLASMLGAVVLFGPSFAVVAAFEHGVDVPACRALCADHGLEFASFTSGKSGSFCRCSGGTVFRAHFNVTGGQGFFDGVVDWFVRASSALCAALVLPGLALAGRLGLGRFGDTRRPS